MVELVAWAAPRVRLGLGRALGGSADRVKPAGLGWVVLAVAALVLRLPDNRSER